MSDDRKRNQALDVHPEPDPAEQVLREVAGQIRPDPRFVASLERRITTFHREQEVPPMFTLKMFGPVFLWVLAAAVMILVIDWAIRSIAPQPVPAARKTPVATVQAPAPPVEQSTPVPSARGYDWRGSGTKLYLAASLPDEPVEAGVYAAQPAAHATVEEAMALAQRFGISGESYQTNGELPGTTDYIITDGKQSLRVRSADYFTYTADIIRSFNNLGAVKNPDAENIIGAFLQSHGFTFPHLVQWSDWRSAYVVEAVTAEGTPLGYEHFSPPMVLITLDEEGNVASLRANLMNTSGEPLGPYAILSAEEAFQKLLDPNTVSGMTESMNSSPAPIQQWTRSYPLDQRIEIFGNVTSAAAVLPGQPAFIQIDGFPVTGQAAGLDQLRQPTYVEATGKFILDNGIERFNIDTWKVSDVPEDGLVGTLKRQGEQVLLDTGDGAQHVLLDVPAAVPMPFENAFVVGTRAGNLFQWKLIDDRMAKSGGGGGGGGAGGGFYKLNLTGTPVPFPSPTAIPAGDQAGSGSNQYVVQAGDTLGAIASKFGTSIGALAQANGLKDPGMLMIGQTLIIPASGPRKVEALRGILSIIINKHEDGSQQVAYGLLANASSDPGGYVLLEGDGLEALQKCNSRPVDIWGALETASETSARAIPVVKVERFVIPFPDLKVQVFKGTQKLADIGGSEVTLFNAEDGTTYMQLLADGTTGGSLIGKEGDVVQVEAVAVPGETVDGHPALRVFGGMLAIEPKTGLQVNLPITMDQPHVVEVPPIGKPSEPPTPTIEKVELIHFMSDPRYGAPTGEPQALYFQPVWRFSGHYSNGDEFEILIQALREEYLLPELEPMLAPG